MIKRKDFTEGDESDSRTCRTLQTRLEDIQHKYHRNKKKTKPLFNWI